MKYKHCEVVEINGKEFIEDYRIGDTPILYINVRDDGHDDMIGLELFEDWFMKSYGIGDLIGSIDFKAFTKEELDELAILKYYDGYAIGYLKKKFYN